MQNTSGAPFVQVGSAPAAGQYTFLNGLYTFNAADQGTAIFLNYIGATNDDQQIQDCITAFSNYVLHLTGRGPADGSIPAHSPLVEPVSYDEFYDGTGTFRLPLRNWPITAVVAVNVFGSAIQQSTAQNVSGWVIDQDARFISLRGGYSATVATFQNYRGGWGGCAPGFAVGVQNVEVQYTAGFSGVPVDLEMSARKVVALNYVRRGWIGQKSQTLAQGGGTTSFGEWEMDADVMQTIQYYRRMVG